MKKIIPFLLLITCTTIAHGQAVNLNLYGAYVFDDKFDSYYDPGSYYEGKIKGGFQWGAGIEFSPREDFGVELLYLRQDTNAPTYYAGGGFVGERQTDFDLTLDYLMLGGLRYFGTSPKVQGYGGLMAGVVFAGIEDPDSGREDSTSKFAWGARLGCNIWGSEKVGLKLQAQLVSATQSMGGGFYFGTGGAGAGLSSYSTIYQFSLGGGLVFKVK